MKNLQPPHPNPNNASRKNNNNYVNRRRTMRKQQMMKTHAFDSQTHQILKEETHPPPGRAFKSK
ncbi:Hypothetical protein FKW44_024842 [Caligus rogercresseyi]|uniref:Uncharacterized protein n=1 Tax=Caligus rogercresseyi TaxID=217165 RepID=A0A7T8GM85_CALRO|nr:Hypothetical protein FKW44_024842 [Caligus rogercresseyi]